VGALANSAEAFGLGCVRRPRPVYLTEKGSDQDAEIHASRGYPSDAARRVWTVGDRQPRTRSGRRILLCQQSLWRVRKPL